MEWPRADAKGFWAPSEEEQLVAKTRDATFAIVLRAWLLRHRAAQLLARRATTTDAGATREPDAMTALVASLAPDSP